VNTISYTTIGGIMFGQFFIGGFLVDRIGRKAGSIFTAAVMTLFGFLIACSYGTNQTEQLTMFTTMQFFFGIGVGGEYPTASTSANERAEATKTLNARRGETVISVFSMQGWGNFINTLVICLMMALMGQTGAAKTLNGDILAIIWRSSYLLGVIPALFMLFWRIFVLKESAVWLGKRRALKDLGPVDNAMVMRKYGLYFYHYWHRSFATAIAWFVWDFAFYGNKLFQGTFIKVINPGAGPETVLWWTLLNSGVSLIGYYFAAFTIDKRWMGRRFMQAMGFTWMFLLFGASAIWFKQLQTAQNIHAFQFLYYFSSFWGQYGPNATTWILPAELAPTELRSFSHGLSAAVGKAGALVSGVVFGLVNNEDKFILSAVMGAAGAVLTVLMIGDLTGLDLKEGDKRWLALLDGKSYHGESVNPKYLSLFERMLGYGKLYDPAAASVGGKYHTEAAQVAGMIVGTKTEAGAGDDTMIEPRGTAGKDASFEAKNLQYI
jgi:MFS family permease